MLPDWFGQDEANQHYLEIIDDRNFAKKTYIPPVRL